MKIGVYGESPADEEAVALLVAAILGEMVERADLPSLRARGYTQMASELPRVIKSLHYNSDAEALVVIIDSNGKEMHSPDHDAPGAAQPTCRLCELRTAAERGKAGLKPRQQGEPLKVAIGLAVPAFEAWLLSAREQGMSEANWRNARKENPPREPYAREQLKVMLYGTKTPSLELETAKMVEAMQLVVKDIAKLERAFPDGFGHLRREIQSWKK